MAAHNVLVWRIDTIYPGSWPGSAGPYTLQAGNFIHVQLDDATGVITCIYAASSTEGAGTIGTLTDGPNLFFGLPEPWGAATLLTTSPYYQFCEGTVLRKIGTNSLFPYANLSYNPGAVECAIVPVCDLEISSIYTVTDATGPINADGQIEISATSSNGVIKYSLNPSFNYATEGQTSPIFSGLLPDTYTIYAKDEAGCTDQIDIEVPITIVYGVKYRLDFQDVKKKSGKIHRVDILERAYAGAITEFCGSGDPVHIRWNGDSDDPSKTIIPGEYVLQMMRLTAGEFADLATQDDELFKIQHYVDSALYWSGFVRPNLGSEPFIKEPYEIEVTAVDGLQLLTDKDFLDESGNKYKGELKTILVVAEILKKCALNFDIHCGINIYAVYDIAGDITPMSTTGDPLDQAYIDVSIFEGLKCFEVLSRILAPFRAQIFQADGKWWIIRISDAVGTFPYRVFDYTGTLLSDTTVNPVQEITYPSLTNRGTWVGLTQFLSHVRNYGYFSVTHDAFRDNNLIDEGRFEAEDVIPLGSGNSTFKNWNFFLAQAGVKYGFEYVKNGDSEGAALVSFRSAGLTPQADNKLYSVTIPLSRFSQGYLGLKFQYQIRPNYTDLPYIRLGWSVKVFNATTSIYMSPSFPPDFSRISNTEEIINDLYVTTFGSFQTLECRSLDMFPGTAFDDQMYCTITFYMHNHYGRDFADITALKTFSISSKEIKTGRKVMVIDSTLTRQYVSVASLDAESLPEKVRPNDYASDYLWEQEKVINLPGTTSLVADFLIDNVELSLFPRSVVSGQTVHIEPPKTIRYEQEVSKFIQSNLNKPVYLGDMPIFDDTNVDVVHYNNERLIYRGWFRDVDGNPTYRWARLGVAESKKLLQILLEDYRDQFSTPKRKLSGTFTSDIVWSFLNAAQEIFEGSRYRFLKMDFDCRNAEYTVDMVEVGAGEDGSPPLVTGAFDKQAFSSGFLIGS